MVNRMALLGLAFGSLILAGCPNDLGKNVRKGSGSPVADPTNLVASPSGGFDVQLTWGDNAVGEGGYRLEMNHGEFGSNPAAEFRILPPESTSCLFPVIPNTTYYFRVFAVTQDQESGPSNVASLTVPKVFDPPHSLLAVSESATQVTLSWSDVRGETGYLVELSRDGGTSWTTAATTGADARTVAIPGLSSDTEVLLRMMTVYSYGMSNPSAPVGVLTLTATASRRLVTAQADRTWISLARSSSGVVNISSYEAISSSVLHTLPFSGDPNLYTSGVVDSGPTGAEDVGSDGTSLVLDPGGIPHGVAHDATNNALRYWTNSSGPDVAMTIDTGGGAGPKIVRSPLNGALHALYRHSSTRLKHLVKEPGQGWNASEVLDVELDPATPHAAAIDPTGSPHVVLVNSQKQLVYAVRPVDFGVWVYYVQPQWPTTLRPDHVSIAVDATNKPHIAFHDALTRTLHHLTLVNAQWVTEAIDQTPGADVGSWPAMAVQPGSARLHVAYYDATRGDLRYARKDPNGVWVRRLIDAVGDVGTYASIVAESSGRVTIAYRDSSSGQIKLSEGSY